MKMLSTLAMLLVLASAAAEAGEKSVDRKTLPAAVQTAISQEEAKGGAIGRITEEKEQGKTTYEVETKVAGRSRDLVFSPAGTLIESEDETAIAAIPPAARAAFEKAGKVLKVERVTRGASVTYEAEIEKAGKKSELAVDAAGKRFK
jgi:uncharacterized membrane protein YkoI